MFTWPQSVLHAVSSNFCVCTVRNPVTLTFPHHNCVAIRSDRNIPYLQFLSYHHLLLRQLAAIYKSTVKYSCTINYIYRLYTIGLHTDRPTHILQEHITRSSADADNRLDAFSGQSRSTNMVPFHMLHIVSYCAIVTLSFTIFVFKKFHDLEMAVKGHSRSLRVLSFYRLCMVSY